MASAEHDAVVVALVASIGEGSALELTLEEQRASYDAMGNALPLAADVTIITVDAGGVPAEWIETSDVDPERVVLYFHGGGYVTGSVRSHRELISRLARAARARALNADYRLAPEHPYPAALEDGLGAYRWLLDIGTEPAHIAIAGDSAGGGLALSVTLATRTADLPAPAAVAVMAPWVDLTLTEDELVRRAERDPLYSDDSVHRILEMADHYLAGADPRSPLISPLRGDLARLPPVLVQVGTADLLYEAAGEFVTAANAAGSPAELDTYDGCVHVFQQLVPHAPEAAKAVARLGDFIREHTTRTSGA
jgi:acetyl esterase/lipase